MSNAIRIIAFRYLALSLIFAFSGPPARAAIDRWTPRGPFGGAVEALAADPHRPGRAWAYVASARGRAGRLFRTEDRGATWAIVEAWPAGVRARSLAVDPRAPGILYAGTAGHGVLKTTDGGATFTATAATADDPIGAAEVTVLELDPASSEVLFAGTSGGDLFRSTDAGATWTHLLAESAGFTDLAIDPTEPRRMYLASLGLSVLWSRDGGASWMVSSLNDVTPQAPAVVVDPAAPDTVYAATFEGVFKSIDAGSTWRPASAGLDSRGAEALILDPGDPGTLYLASFDTGVWITRDGGDSWRRATGGLSDPGVLGLALDPFDGASLYAATRSSGVFRSADRAASWTPANRGLVPLVTEVVAVDPHDPKVLWAGTFGDGVRRSTDRGSTWIERSEGLVDRDVLALAIDPEAPATLYAGTGSGVFRTVDAAARWQPTSGLVGETVVALAIDPSDPKRVYAGTAGGGVWRSGDRGATWQPAGDGLPPGAEIYDLVLDPERPTTLWAASLGAVYRSRDRGRRWEKVSDELDAFEVRALAVLPGEPLTLLAGTGYGSGGVRRSTDGGRTWTPSNAGLSHLSVLSLAVDPRDPRSVYLGSEGGGVSRSTDGGRTWSPINQGLPRLTVLDLTVSPPGPAPAAPPIVYAIPRFDAVWDLQPSAAGGEASGDGETGAGGSPTVLEVQDGRFTVAVEWLDTAGESGPGRLAEVAAGAASATPLQSTDSAVLSFFGPGNWELLIKVLDARSFNDSFWVFLAAATDVEFTTTVVDTRCGTTRRYQNPLGAAAPAVTDTAAFSDCAAPEPPSCEADGATVCLGDGGRFAVSVDWTDFSGAAGEARLVNLPRAGLARSDTSGLFYFFSPENWELLVKVLDGCAVNDHFWVFSAATTDVGFTLTVRDNQTDTVRTFTHPPGAAADALNDTEAFATCS